MPNELTPNELKQLKKRIRDLEKKIIPKLMARIRHAWEDGDWSEYNIVPMTQELESLQQELANLKEAVRNAKIVKREKGKVGIGSKIKLKIDERILILELTNPLLIL